MRNYKMQDGLAHDNVFRAIQDRRGFMCFATNYGLSIFDGRTFHNYTSADGLSENCIISVSEDAQEQKLISTYGGGVCIMDRDGRISQVRPRHGNIPANTIFTASRNGYLWIIGLDTGGYRLYRYRDGISRKVHLADRNGQELYILRSVHLGQDLVFLTSSGPFRVVQDTLLQPLQLPSAPSGITDLCLDHSGSYWASTADSLFCLGPGGIRYRFAFRDGRKISSMAADRQNRLWVSTVGAGLFLLADGRLDAYTRPLHLPGIILNHVTTDREGSVWIASHGAGVYQLTSLNAVHYAPQEGRMSAYCKAITPAGGGAFYTGSIGTISLLEKDTLRPIKTAHLHAADFIYFIRVLGRFLYYGTPYGLYRRSLLPPYSEIPIRHPGVSKGAISFYTDSAGTSWVGSFSGLYQLQDDSLILRERRAGNRRINAITGGTGDTLWLGTDAGLYWFRTCTASFGPVAGLPGPGRINALLTDPYHRLWIASAGGLCCRTGSAVIRYTTADGLMHNSCNALAVEDSSTLWIGTTTGLSYTDLRHIRLKQYQSDIYPNEVLALHAAGGKIYAGLVNGLSVLLPRAGEEALPPPPLYITSIRSGSLAVPADRELRLSYRHNKLSIGFIGISFRYADRVVYRYRIQNLDDSWHLTTNNAIELPALPSGRFVLVLSARLGAGPWGREVRLPIYVSTPYWRTWWFRLLAVGLAAALLLILTRWRTLRLEKRKRARLAAYNKIVYLKQQALSALINPHFIFNCMNSIQHFLNRHDNDRANSYLADFAQLIRLTMEQAQEAFITLDQEHARILLYLSLEQLRFGDDLRYELDVDPRLDRHATRIPNMMLQPYVENAIWHGLMPKKAPGKIIIRFCRDGADRLKITIQDDGKGYDGARTAAGHQRQGYGQRLTAERLQLLSTLLHQYYTVTTGPAFPGAAYPGVCVTLTMPLYPRQDLLQLAEQGKQ